MKVLQLVFFYHSHSITHQILVIISMTLELVMKNQKTASTGSSSKNENFERVKCKMIRTSNQFTRKRLYQSNMLISPHIFVKNHTYTVEPQKNVHQGNNTGVYIIESLLIFPPFLPRDASRRV